MNPNNPQEMERREFESRFAHINLGKFASGKYRASEIEWCWTGWQASAARKDAELTKVKGKREVLLYALHEVVNGTTSDAHKLLVAKHALESLKESHDPKNS